MRKIALVITVFALFSGCNRVKQFATPEQMVEQALKIVKTISVDELNKLMDSEEIYTLIDVRQKSEHYHGFIPGSLVIPRGSIEFLIGKEKFWEEEGLYMPLKDEKIILYCRKGNRGSMAASSLVQLGYKNVFTLDGGWKKWELTYPDLTDKNLDMLSGGGAEAHDDGGGC
ncbi:MAG: rhodanese-like domain-containing protein [Cytophagales bacterium]|nr:rhodanese-like domain-containing protein [Cytophagales bacterium]